MRYPYCQYSTIAQLVLATYIPTWHCCLKVWPLAADWNTVHACPLSVFPSVPASSQPLSIFVCTQICFSGVYILWVQHTCCQTRLEVSVNLTDLCSGVMMSSNSIAEHCSSWIGWCTIATIATEGIVSFLYYSMPVQAATGSSAKSWNSVLAANINSKAWCIPIEHPNGFHQFVTIIIHCNDMHLEQVALKISRSLQFIWMTLLHPKFSSGYIDSMAMAGMQAYIAGLRHMCKLMFTEAESWRVQSNMYKAGKPA